MTIHGRATRALGLLGVLASIGSCADNITEPPRQLPSPLVISDAAPNVAPISTSSRGVRPASLATATAATETDVAYISLVPGTYPNGVTAAIRNVHLDATVTAPMVDGGLDPVPVPATEGDTLEIEVLSATGASLAQTALASGIVSDVPAGDDWVGLVRAFLGVGAANVIATLWPVEDRATAKAMELLYRRLRAGDTELASLAAAQREALRSATTSDPFYWAGFVWLGEAE